MSTEGGNETMIGNLEIPLLDQGAVQFMVLVAMIVVVCFLLWITISK